MVRARRATASWPSRYDTLGNSTESFIAAGGYHHTWNEAGMRILVVEDEREVASFIRQGLEEEGHTVEVAADGAAALDLRVAGPPHDLVVLDLMLPKRDGFEVLRQARSKHVETPVLVLTARDGVSDRVMGLDLGADDYLTKPFAFEEFLARVRALLRRRDVDRIPVLRMDDLTVDPATRRVTRGDRRIELTARQYALLEYFLHNAGRVLSRQMIGQHVWGLAFDAESNVIDVYVGHLRRKIDRNRERRLLHTVPSDAIVVLGGWVSPSGLLSLESLRRTNRGIDLYRRGLAPVLVLLGGATGGGPTEADVRAEQARLRGVPPDAILTEARARTTREEAFLVKAP